MLYNAFYKWRKSFIWLFVLLSIGSAFLIRNINFEFGFEQFFPQGDEDLEFFLEFVDEFETDDNFLLIALENKPSVFDTGFLHRVKDFSVDARRISFVKSVQSLPLSKYPIMTPFGPSGLPVVHLDDPGRLAQDSIRVLNDERFVYQLINQKGNSTSVILKFEDGIQLAQSQIIMHEVDSLLNVYAFDNHYMLGRPYFQDVLSETQIKEILLSTIISGILISIIMILIFKRWQSIFIALSSLGIGLLLFMGVLSFFDRSLTLMSALYPVLMLIVGTSDVIHIMSKYMDELKKGVASKPALKKTIKQIGLATLLTSLTTAAGFLTLLSSRIIPIREFGVNSAIGVVIAYIVVIGFTCPLLTLFTRESLVGRQGILDRWSSLLSHTNRFTIRKSKAIGYGALVFLVLSAIGISKIHTNYDITSTLPKGAKITEDFKYFEREYSGFRPLEVAVYVQDDYEIFDYEVVDAIARTEAYILSQDEIQSSFSIATLVKSINQMMRSNQPEYYIMPNEEAYNKQKKYLSRLPGQNLNLLINDDKLMTRISTRVKDVGSENIGLMSDRIDGWIDENIDQDIVQFRQTGTGVILDKNSEFIRQSLTVGLGIALLMVSLIMGFFFRNIKMLFIALVPNILPLLFAAAILGYFNIALEAGISIVFAIIFGIAVDDTIHFLSKYKLAMDFFGDREKALDITFQESGKAIIFTSIILFFGFLVLLFSNNGPSVIIGMLISVTLLSAVIADLILLPVLIRKFRI